MHMNKSELKRFQETLRQREAGLEQEIAEVIQELRSPAERSAEMYDMAAEHQRTEELLNAKQRLDAQLAGVRVALARLARGEHHCRECGEEIGLPRLRANPQATFCLDCAQEAEQRVPARIA